MKFSSLEIQTTILTPTRRLATYLTECLVTESLKTASVVLKPYIFSLEDALLQMFQQMLLRGKISGSLISNAESLLLLEDIIHSSESGAGLLKITTTAKLVWQAWQHFALWNGDFDQVDWSQEDSKAFYVWIQQYRSKLKQSNWIDKTDIAHCLCEHIKKNTEFLNVSPHRSIELYGFDDIPPQYQMLLEHLKQVGWQIFEKSPDVNAIVPIRHRFQTVENEFKATAEWAKSILELDNNARIGIVIPELPRYRLIVEKIFRDIFHPDALLYPEPVVSEYYNISAGQPLNTIPIIRWALDILSNISDDYYKIDYATWHQVFNQHLKSSNWPGERVLDSIEHQAVKQWIALMEDFAKLDRLFEPVQHTVAYLKLKHLIQDIPFQPQSHVVRLHVLGALEAAGQNFTHLWISGLNDADWPSLPDPNPFLPMTLQKEKNMPHATHERQWTFAEKMTQRFLSAARHIIVSHAEIVSNQTHSPSALVKNYTETPYSSDSKSCSPSLFETIFNSVSIESITDDKAPALAFNKIPASSKTLKLQAHCPFRAFAEIRLELIDKSETSLGLSLRDRGILTHRILDALWSILKTQKALLTLSEVALQELIQVTVKDQLKGFETFKPGLKFWDIEQNRLEKLMLAWLNLEKKRSPFEVIARESYYPINIEGMNLKVCIDRVDKDDSNQYFIIDYKTGQVDLSGLLGEDLLEPQLPLYCFNNQFPTPAGIVFGQVKGDKCRFVGLSQAPQFPDVKVFSEDEWASLLHFWQSELERLVNDFKSGKAGVTPANRNKVCRYCHLPSFCRIKERTCAR
ncbi:MAG: PD-(D/E)XK nuclease family protein [Gammaproteobacteria bacterium]